MAHNEARQIAACLEGLRFADEIVVVLDRCTDDTRVIAQRFTDRLIEGAWPLAGDRRNAGIEASTGDWIVEVDCDERLSPALAAEIRQHIAGAEPGHYLIPFDNYIGDRLVRHGWGAAFGVSAAPRLFTRGAKRWGRERVHPRLQLSGAKGRLREPMAHYVDRDISDMLARLDRYTTLRAADLRAAGDIGSIGANIRRIFTRFWKCYIQRKGYREGHYGFLIALLAGLYPILSYLKARLERDQ
jgi:glycosyltransferase involved in cell wall biosynthesis